MSVCLDLPELESSSVLCQNRAATGLESEESHGVCQMGLEQSHVYIRLFGKDFTFRQKVPEACYAIHPLVHEEVINLRSLE